MYKDDIKAYLIASCVFAIVTLVFYIASGFSVLVLIVITAAINVAMAIMALCDYLDKWRYRR